MVNLILFGPPGSGKGTQAAKLVDRYQLVHISTGDLFRRNISQNTPLGQRAQAIMAEGKLVPDEVTIAMLRDEVEANPQANGFIFDGFPRTIPQAEALDALLVSKDSNIAGLVALSVDDEEIVARIKKRGLTSGRADDNDESIIRKRISVYNAETAQVFDYYAQQGKSHTVEGIGTIEEIFDKLTAVIDGL